MCVINSVKFATEYMDLLEAIMLPMTESETVKFTNGIGGFPAYELTTQTQIQSPAINLIEAIFEDFAIRMILKTKHTCSWLFVLCYVISYKY